MVRGAGDHVVPDTETSRLLRQAAKRATRLTPSTRGDLVQL